MKDGLVALRKTGVLNGLETVPQLGSLLQSAAKFGPDAVKSWALGQANAVVLNQINKLSKNAQVAIKVANSIIGAVFGGSSARGPIAIAGIVGTVNRLPVTNAIAGVIGDKKVPVPDYTVTSVDIRKGQQEVRTEAFNKAIAEGKTEREAARIGAAAGNDWGAAELAKFGTGTGTTSNTTTATGTTGRTNSLQEFQQTFGTQTAQSAGQSTFLGTGSGLPVSAAGSNADAALAQTRGTTNINYADSQFQSQAQLDAEVAQEAKLAANKDVLGRLTR
jgi:hypothetical protein